MGLTIAHPASTVSVRACSDKNPRARQVTCVESPTVGSVLEHGRELLQSVDGSGQAQGHLRRLQDFSGSNGSVAVAIRLAPRPEPTDSGRQPAIAISLPGGPFFLRASESCGLSAHGHSYPMRTQLSCDARRARWFSLFCNFLLSFASAQPVHFTPKAVR